MALSVGNFFFFTLLVPKWGKCLVSQICSVITPARRKLFNWKLVSNLQKKKKKTAGNEMDSFTLGFNKCGLPFCKNKWIIRLKVTKHSTTLQKRKNWRLSSKTGKKKASILVISNQDWKKSFRTCCKKKKKRDAYKTKMFVLWQHKKHFSSFYKN